MVSPLIPKSMFALIVLMYHVSKNCCQLSLTFFFKKKVKTSQHLYSHSKSLNCKGVDPDTFKCQGCGTRYRSYNTLREHLTRNAACCIHSGTLIQVKPRRKLTIADVVKETMTPSIALMASFMNEPEDSESVFSDEYVTSGTVNLSDIVIWFL